MFLVCILVHVKGGTESDSNGPFPPHQKQNAQLSCFAKIGDIIDIISIREDDIRGPSFKQHESLSTKLHDDDAV